MQRPFRTALSLAMICGLLIFGAVPAAYAVPVLSLSDGIHPTVTITDGGLGDLASDPGAILFYGALGNFGINITAGTTKPAIGSADEPILDISSLNITSFGAGTLMITFSETGFTGQVPAFTGSVGGTTTGTGVTYSASLDGVLLGTTGVLTGSSFSSVFVSNFGPPPGSYTLAQQIVITHSAAGQITSVDAMLHAPEPASLVLLGSGLLGLGLLGWRKRGLGFRSYHS